VGPSAAPSSLAALIEGLVQQHDGVPASVEVSTADRLEPLPVVIRGEGSVVLVAVQAQLAATRLPGLLPGPFQQGPSPPEAGVSAINDQAVDVRRVRGPPPPRLLVVPQQPQRSEHGLAGADHEPLASHDLAANLLQRDLTGLPLTDTAAGEPGRSGLAQREHRFGVSKLGPDRRRREAVLGGDQRDPRAGEVAFQ